MRIASSLVLSSIVLCTAAIAHQPQRGERPGQGDPRQAGGRGGVPDDLKIERDVQYVAGGDKAQSLDLYLPDKSEKPLPLVVWIHGGGFSAGDKSPCPAVWLVAHGYVVASLNYRLSGQAIFPAQIQDCQAAFRWLRANRKKYNIDPDHIGAWGASAGGHLVALLGTDGGKKTFSPVGGNEDQSDRVQAVCDFFGPTDFVRMDEQAIAGAPLRHNAPGSPEARLIGGPVQDNKDKSDAASPIHYVSRDNPPFLIMHGTADPLVPVGQSDLLAEALKNAGVAVLLQKLPGSGHGGPVFGRPVARDLVLAFFDKNLKGLDVKVEPIPDEALALGPGEQQVPGRNGDNRPPDPNIRPAERDGHGDAGRLGGPFEQLTGLTDEQKTRLIEIRNKYEEIVRKQREEMLGVLTDAQRQELEQIINRGRQRLPVAPRERGQEAAPRAGRDPAPAREGGREPAVSPVDSIIEKVEVPNIWLQPSRQGDDPIKIGADDKTVITLDGKPAVFAALKVGQHVTVEYPAGAAAAAHIDARSDSAAPAPPGK